MPNWLFVTGWFAGGAGGYLGGRAAGIGAFAAIGRRLRRGVDR